MTPPERVIELRMMTMRLLAMLMAALLAMAVLVPSAVAEDWRDQLRAAFGLTEETESEPVETAQPEPTAKAKEEIQWSYPITDPQEIVNYLDAYGRLPDNFITKREAKELGWDSYYNYVGDVAPGKSIGGDKFGNYEGQLPKAKGRTWYECDTGYRGKKRGATRLLFSSDGLYFYTDDHYNTFTQMYPEE